MAEPEVMEREIPYIDGGALAVITRGEIDMQVATAHKFPRSVSRFQGEVMSLVTLNEQVAQECIYALPRDGKIIEGASARFGEIIAHAWGNCRAGARVVDDRGEFVTAQGVFHDLEKNCAITYEVKRRITTKDGKRYKPDMIGVTANAACSIALRNAIMKGVPRAFWSAAYDAARKVIMGDFQTLANRRAAALEAFQKFGVKPEQIFDKLEIKGVEEISLEHIVILRGLLTALKDGDTSVEETFTKPVEQPKAKAPAQPAAKPPEAAKPAATQQAEAPTATDAPAETKAATTADTARDAAAKEQAAGIERAAKAKAAEEAKQHVTPTAKPATEALLSMAQKNIVKAKCKNAKIAVEDLIAQFGEIDKMPASQFSAALEWIEKR